MKFLKGMALGLLASLLFVSLFVLSPAIALNRSVLNPGFLSEEIRKLDTADLTQELMPEKLPGDLQPYSSSISATILELKPWIDSQAQLGIEAVYDYLAGKTAALDFTIPAGIVRQTLIKNFEAAYKKSPPPQYSRLTAAQQEQALTQAEQQVSDLLPRELTIEINEKTLGTDATRVLQSAKKVYSSAKRTYQALVAAAIVLICLIVILLRLLKGIARTLGIVFVLAGGLGYGLFWVIRILAVRTAEGSDWPGQIQVWIPELIRDAISPMGVFSLVLLIGGAALLASSFFFRSDH